MQRQSCCSAKFLPILHLTFSGREPLPWPQAMKISRAPKPTSRCVFQLLLAVVNTHSSQLLSCWLGLGHPFPMINILQGTETSQLPLHTLLEHTTIIPGTTTPSPLTANASVNIELFCSISAPELYRNAWPHKPAQWKQDSCHRTPSAVCFYQYWCFEDQLIVFTAVSMHSGFLQVYEFRGMEHPCLTQTRDTAAEILHSLNSHYISQHLVLVKKTDTTLLLVCEYCF